MLADVNKLAIIRPSKLLPPGRDPEDQTNQHDNSRCCRRVIHVFLVHRVDTRQIGDNTYECQVEEPDNVEQYAILP